MPWPGTTELVGRDVALLPLSHEHHDELADATRDGELWKLWYTVVPSPEEMRSEIERRLGLFAAGSMVPFTVIADGRAIGMTTFMNIDATNRRVEIGSTWYAKRFQRTAINTEAKRLLLAWAFETLDCVAVEFRTSSFNHASRRAIERLGARQDGILRSHGRHRDGSIRDTVVFSILATEWPAVRTHLDFQLHRER
jgi:RimJ/RimL family protein N-acetyltransferase